MRNEELHDSINNHPLLDLPANERMNEKNAANRYRLINDLMNYYHYSEKLQRRLSPERALNRSALSEEETERDNFRNSSTRKGMQFDSVAFMEAVNNAISSYDSSRGASFLTWFATIYKQQFAEADRPLAAIQNQAIQTPRLKGINREIFTKFMDYLQRRNIPPENVSDEFLAKAAEAIRIDTDKLRQILRIRAMKFTASLSSTGESSSEEEDKAINPADSSQEALFTNAENAMLLDTVLDLLADYDEQEYPRLFFNNIFLGPLKDPDAPDPEGQLLILKRNEKMFWRSIFIRPYLEFTLAAPPKPDSLAHIVACSAVHPFNNKTISIYKKCSAANVSQQYAKFRQLQKKIKMTVEVIRS